MRFGVAFFGCLALATPACSDDGGDGESTNVEQEPGCEGRGEPVVPGMNKQSEDGLLTASLLTAAPLPPVQGINSWTVELSQALEPIVDAGDADSQVVVNIFMVEHDHNVRTIGVMTEPGVFEIPDFPLTMNGYWEVTIDVQPDMPAVDDAAESVVFGFCVEN